MDESHKSKLTLFAIVIVGVIVAGYIAGFLNQAATPSTSPA